MSEIRETVGVYQRLGTAIIESNRVATTRRLNANRPSLDSSVDRSPEAVVPWKRPDETRRRRRIFVQKAKVNRGSPSSHNSNRRVASINSSASPTTRLVARPTINLTSPSPSSLFLSPPPSLSLWIALFQNARSHARRHCCTGECCARAGRAFIDDFHFLRFIGLLKVTFVQAVTLD